jgi:hypothetical protein
MSLRGGTGRGPLISGTSLWVVKGYRLEAGATKTSLRFMGELKVQVQLLGSEKNNILSKLSQSVVRSTHCRR